MIARILLRVVLPAIVAGVMTYALVGLIPNSYSSYQTLYFPLNPSGGIGALGPIAGAPSGGDAGAVPGLGGAIMYPLIGSGSQTAAGIVTSHACREEVARELRLPERWRTNLLNATKRLDKAVTADTDKAGLLLIRVTAESPDLCVAINRQIFDYLRQRTRELSQNASVTNRQLVERRLAVAQSDLRRAEARVIRVVGSTPFAGIDEVQKRYLAAQTALAEARSSRDQRAAGLARMESEFQRLSHSGNTAGTVTAISALNPAFDELAQELQRRRLALDDAMIALSSTNPRVYQAKEAYENAKRASEQVKAGLATRAGIASPEIIRARAELSSLDAAVSSGEKALNDSARALSSSPRQYTRSKIVRDEFESVLGRVSLLKQELERAAVMETRDPNRFEVIDEPYEDPTPVGPRRLLFAAVAFLAIATLAAIPFLIGIVRAAEASATGEPRVEIA